MPMALNGMVVSSQPLASQAGLEGTKSMSFRPTPKG